MTIRNGTCPNCQSTEIFWRDDDDGDLRVDWKTTVHLTVYVCTNCGYIQRFIESEKHIDRIREKWTHRHDKPKRKSDER